MIVCTAGGIEEDFIKCMGDTHVGDFALKGEELRKKGINRIGNLLIPNQVLRNRLVVALFAHPLRTYFDQNYCKFEDWIMPILDQMLEEQKTQV